MSGSRPGKGGAAVRSPPRQLPAHKASGLLTRATGFPVSVGGIGVPVDANAFTVKAQPDDVHVINRGRLIAHLRSCPESLRPTPVARPPDGSSLSRPG
jgi:hypothetical protein